MRNAETRSILARSALDARSLRMPNDSASTIRSSVLSTGGDLDRSLGVDEELVRSGPYLSHYREMVSRQRGVDGRNRQELPSILSEETATASTLRGSVSSPPAALTMSASASTKRSSSSLSGITRAWKSSHEGRLLVAQLCQASKDGNVKWAERLVNDGADIDGYCIHTTKISPARRWSITRKGKETPLVCAVEAGHLEMVKFLLNRGADPNNPDAMEPSALVIAVREATAVNAGKGQVDKYKEMITLLLENEANAEAPNDLPWSLNPLTIAIHEMGYDVAKLLLQHGANPNQPRSGDSGKEREWRPLHVAAEASGEFVDLLLDHGATLGLTGVRDGVAKVTALHVAGDGDVARRLISAGASVFAVDSNGQTPLFWALKKWPHRHEYGTTFSNEILLIISANVQNGSPVNLRDTKGKTPLALIQKRPDFGRVADALLAAGAER